jgi:hypothetical protein
MQSENGTDYVEQFLKPAISCHMDILTSRAQMIAMDKEMDNKLAELRQAGRELKFAVTNKIDRLIEQATVKKPDPEDQNYKEQAEIYAKWLDQAIEGMKKVHSFFDRVWIKIKELLDKVFYGYDKVLAIWLKKYPRPFVLLKQHFYDELNSNDFLIGEEYSNRRNLWTYLFNYFFMS